MVLAHYQYRGSGDYSPRIDLHNHARISLRSISLKSEALVTLGPNDKWKISHKKVPQREDESVTTLLDIGTYESSVVLRN